MLTRRRTEGGDEGLNLIPIMNLVLILIPLLLLSVVFLEKSVIPVQMPSTGQLETPVQQPQRLQLVVARDGFWLTMNGQAMQQVASCPRGPSSPTICLVSPAATEPLERYDWLALYNELMAIKSDSDWREHDTIEVVPGADVRFNVVVKAMDVVRYQRAPDGAAVAGTAFGSVEELYGSDVVRVTADEGGMRELGLFPMVVLGIPTSQ